MPSNQSPGKDFGENVLENHIQKGKMVVSQHLTEQGVQKMEEASQGPEWIINENDEWGPQPEVPTFIPSGAVR